MFTTNFGASTSSNFTMIGSDLHAGIEFVNHECLDFPQCIREHEGELAVVGSEYMVPNECQVMNVENNCPAHCSTKRYNSKIMSNNNSSNDLAYHEICGDEFHVIVAKEERRGLVDGGSLSPSISPYSTFQPSPSCQSSPSSSRQLPREEINSITQYKAVQVRESPTEDPASHQSPGRSSQVHATLWK